MKKQLLLTMCCAFAVTTASASVDWSSITNIAKGAAVTVSTKDADAATITDDNDGTRWQGYKTEGLEKPDEWVLIDFGSSQSFNLIELNWEASHPTKYDIYVGDNKPTWTEQTFSIGEQEVVRKVIDDTWLTNNAAAKTDLGQEVDAYFEVVTGEFTGQYVLIYAKEARHSMKIYGMSLWEFRAGTAENTDELNKLEITSATITAGGNADVTVKAFDKLGNNYDLAKIEDLKVTSDPAVTITKKETGIYNVSATEPGIYTLTASAGAISATSNLSVTVDWSKLNNIAIGKTAYASHNTGIVNESIDGNLNTRWGVGDNITTDTWYYVDLGGEYVIKNLGIIWESAYCSDYKYYYATETETVEGVEQPKWTELAHIQKYLSAANLYTDTYVIPSPVTARYVKIECIKSELWGMSFYEFMVDGASVETPVATTIEFTATPANGLFVGETSALTAVVKDQFGSVMNITPTLEIVSGEGSLNGNTFTATAKSTTEIKATAGKISKTITIVTAADKASFIATDDMTAESDAKNADGKDSAKGAVDGTIDNNKDTWQAGRSGFGENDNEGAHEHWLIVDLGKKYNLDMITADWEGASSNNYDITIAETKEALETATPAYTVNDGFGVKARNDRFFGKPMENVRFIKLASHSNASGYGLNLFELRMFGSTAEKSVPATITTTTNLGGNVLFLDDTPETATLSSLVLDQFGDEIDGQQVTYSLASAADESYVTLEGNQITAKGRGTASIIAKCGEMEQTVTFSVTSHDKYLLNIEEGVNKGVLCDVNLNRFDNGFDGNDDTVAELGKDDITVFADCGYRLKINIEAVTIKWERACPKDYNVYIISYEGLDAFKRGEKPEPVFTARDMKADGNSPIAFTHRIAVNPEDQTGNAKDLVIIEATGNSFEGYGKNLYEIRVYGETTTIPSGVAAIETEDANTPVNVYNISGALIRQNVMPADATNNLAPGFYIVGNKKVFVK